MTMMETNQSTQSLSTMFYGSVTFNGPMFDIHDNGSVVIHGGSASQENGEQGHSAVPDAPSPWERDGERPPLLVRVVEAVQSYFWAQSSWAVGYCVCRDHLGMRDSMSEFERHVAELPFTRKVVECPAGTVRKAFINNDYLRYSTDRWPEGRARVLAEKLMEKFESPT